VTAAPLAPIPVEFSYAAVTAPYWHLFVGQDKGFYAEQGVDLSAIFVPSGYPGVVQGLVSGSVGIGSLSADTAIPAIQQGADLVYVGSEMHMSPTAIVAQPEIRSFADVRGGKKVGVGSLRGGTSAVLRIVFTKNGLVEGEDYSMVTAGTTNERLAGLQNKSFDVAPVGQPQDYMLQASGSFTTLGLFTDYIKDFGFYEVFVMRDWARANQEAVVRFLAANTRSLNWLYDPANKDEAIQILTKALKTEESYARQTYDLYVTKERAFVPEGEPTVMAIDATLKAMVDAGELRDTGLSGAQVMDKTYWQMAQERLTRR
jgi:ABC-type nitrate/sulfonate/bicarbonate transport system substrate-binding protein